MAIHIRARAHRVEILAGRKRRENRVRYVDSDSGADARELRHAIDVVDGAARLLDVAVMLIVSTADPDRRHGEKARLAQRGRGGGDALVIDRDVEVPLI